MYGRITAVSALEDLGEGSQQTSPIDLGNPDDVQETVVDARIRRHQHLAAGLARVHDLDEAHLFFDDLTVDVETELVVSKFECSMEDTDDVAEVSQAPEVRGRSVDLGDKAHPQTIEEMPRHAVGDEASDVHLAAFSVAQRSNRRIQV